MGQQCRAVHPSGIPCDEWAGHDQDMPSEPGFAHCPHAGTRSDGVRIGWSVVMPEEPITFIDGESFPIEYWHGLDKWAAERKARGA